VEGVKVKDWVTRTGRKYYNAVIFVFLPSVASRPIMFGGHDYFYVETENPSSLAGKKQK
jgi:hypothetical protein